MKPKRGKLFTNDNPLDISIENLLDALDGSYCTASESAHGKDCGIYSPTNVITVSYGASEIFYPESLQKRQCHEFLKLGLQGVTVAISSGDGGVSDRPGYDPHNNRDTNGCIVAGNYNATTGFGHGYGTLLNGTVFNPSYPQNCPYVCLPCHRLGKIDQKFADLIVFAITGVERRRNTIERQRYRS